jgi:hypothetical protein
VLRRGEKLRDHAHVARPLYLELRALGLGVRVVDAPGGGPLDYGIALEGLPELPGAVERSVRRCVLANEDGLVRVLLDRRDPDLEAVRREGHCRR